jgi:hypothetical protein
MLAGVPTLVTAIHVLATENTGIPQRNLINLID